MDLFSFSSWQVIFGGGGVVGALMIFLKISGIDIKTLTDFFNENRQAEVEEKKVQSEHTLEILQQIREQYNTLRTDYTELRDKQVSLQEELSNYRQDYYEVKLENESIRKENEKIRRQNTELKKSNEKLNRNNKRLQKVVMFLKARFDRLVEIIVEDGQDLDPQIKSNVKDNKSEVESLLEGSEVSHSDFFQGVDLGISDGFKSDMDDDS